MPEWWTYTLGDFLMFSPRTYARLVERYNAALWPAQIAGGLAAAMLLGLALRPRPRAAPAAAAALAVGWAVVAYGFFWERYAGINLAARPFAGLCALEAALLLRQVRRDGPAVREGNDGPRAAGLVLLAVALLYPALAPLLGRGWPQSEVVGLMPDPTAIATLGWLLAVRVHGVLLAAPLLMAAAGALTLLAMGRPEAVAPGLAVVVTGAALARAHRAK